MHQNNLLGSLPNQVRVDLGATVQELIFEKLKLLTDNGLSIKDAAKIIEDSLRNIVGEEGDLSKYLIENSDK
ncbi:MAG: hypothetical protein ABI721_01870 [Candidatus Dojkabacteria bacterium]